MCAHLCGPRGRVQLFPTLPALTDLQGVFKRTTLGAAPPRPIGSKCHAHWLCSSEADPIVRYFRYRPFGAARLFRCGLRILVPVPVPNVLILLLEWPPSAPVHDPEGLASSAAVMNIRNARVRLRELARPYQVGALGGDCVSMLPRDLVLWPCRSADAGP